MEAKESQSDIRRPKELDYETPLENQECFQHEDTQGDKWRDTGGRKKSPICDISFFTVF